MQIFDQLRADADSHIAKNIDMQAIVYQQGREIAQTYISIMKMYVRLEVQSGHFIQQPDKRLVRSFYRIEEHHFDKMIVRHDRKQSFWTTKWADTVSVSGTDNAVFASFLTSMEEFCAKEGIRLGELCALVRAADGGLEPRKLPVHLVLPEYVEAVGFPYEIEF